MSYCSIGIDSGRLSGRNITKSGLDESFAPRFSGDSVSADDGYTRQPNGYGTVATSLGSRPTDYVDLVSVDLCIRRSVQR